MRKILFYLHVFLMLFIVHNVIAQEAQGKQNKEKVTKWERKARKAEEKADKYRKASVEALNGKTPNGSKSKKLKTKSEKYSTNAEKYRYKGRSIRHIKVQDKSAKRRMKKSLKKHRRYKSNKRRK